MAALALCNLAVASPAQSGSTALTAAPAFSFDIPAQPLSTAIEAYALETGIQVLYDRPEGAEPRSPGAHGLLPADAALRQLLVGTGLRARFQDARDIVLEPISSVRTPAETQTAPVPTGPMLSLDTLHVQAPPTIEVPPEAFDPQFYRRLVQTELQRALERDPETARGAYQTVVRLWLAPGGAVQRVEIVRPTGDAHRDAAIRRVLSHATVQTAIPAEIPQPIVVQIGARSAAH